MKSIVREFAKAAVLAGSLFAASTAADAQQQRPVAVPPAVALSQTPACQAFNYPDRGGFKFDQPEKHQYDQQLSTYAKELSEYSNWTALTTRLSAMGFKSNGVCAYNHGEGAPIILDGRTGTFDINLYKESPWGPQMQTPAELTATLDATLHYTIYNIMNTNGLGRNIVNPKMAPESAAFIRTLIEANAHAEAILFTVERGMEQGKLADLATVIYDNSPMFQDQISELYLKADTGTLTDADRQAFRESVVIALLKNADVRAGQYQMTGAAMQTLAQTGAPINDMFNVTPTDENIQKLLLARFGGEIANMRIDGKPLSEGYRTYWAAQQNDPGRAIGQQLDQLRAMIEQMHRQLRGPQGEQPQPAPEQPAVEPEKKLNGGDAQPPGQQRFRLSPG